MRFTAIGALAFCFLTWGCPSAPTRGGDAGTRGASPDARAPDAAVDAATASAPPDAGAPDEALPPSTSEEMTARGKHLLEAIAHDNADLGTDMLLPRDAYLAVRDSADPGKAWDTKVSNSFRKGVHVLHQRTKGIEKAQFVSFELGHAVQQAPPKRREWKRPLWRVKHSRLTFTLDGRMRRIEIGEMVGWHGAWYVTKLR